MSKHARALLALTGISVFTLAAAQAQTALPAIAIASGYEPIDGPLNSSVTDTKTVSAHSSDAAALLATIPGISLAAGGGVSSLPAIHGLGADRVNILIDGVPIAMACANDMNSPLSYIDPSRIGRLQTIAGITPVSLGGDSIGGTVIVDSPAPFFAASERIAVSGKASAFYRSNASAVGGSLRAAVASDTLSFTYTGAIVRADNYHGGGHDGVVRSTEYEAANHAVTLAWRNDANLVTLDLSQQYIPRQGFANQWMDMTQNQSTHINAHWLGLFDWGTLDARAYWQSLRHEMNFLADKGGMAMGGMPMNTRSETLGYSVKAAVDAGDDDTIRLGSEFQRQALDDWWPAVPDSMMMGPLDYQNITDGKRARLGLFAEWQHRWSTDVVSLIGLRGDQVWSNTGAVQPYSWMDMMNAADAAAATVFNSVPHARHDANIDVTALLRYTPDETASYEFGYARKSRAPNLYERYSWGRGAMASQMIGWFGDGNGYVGNLGLKSEVAHTISATGDWQGGGEAPWHITLTPYYTRVEDYITAKTLKNLSAASVDAPTFDQLQFVNHDAELFGVDLAASLRLWNSSTHGTGDVKVAAAFTQGSDLTSGGALYHIMPLNGTLSLVSMIGAFDTTIELNVVADKSKVDALRHEPKTGAYALIHLRGGYRWKNWRLDVAVENLFDTAYALPLGGQSLGDYSAGGAVRPLPGMGRSFNIALTASLP